MITSALSDYSHALVHHCNTLSTHCNTLQHVDNKSNSPSLAVCVAVCVAVVVDTASHPRTIVCEFDATNYLTDGLFSYVSAFRESYISEFQIQNGSRNFKFKRALNRFSLAPNLNQIAFCQSNPISLSPLLVRLESYTYRFANFKFMKDIYDSLCSIHIKVT